MLSLMTYFILILLIFFNLPVFSNPASTDYVKSAINTLRTELNNQINTNAQAISQIQNQINTELNSIATQNQNQKQDIKHVLENLQQQFTQAPQVITHHIGEIYQGGMIFYVDNSQQHGLMVSLQDAGLEIQWRNGESGDRITNATALGINAGEMNTRIIISQQTSDQQDGEFAAQVAANYQISADGLTTCETPLTIQSLCYGGWYLPSINELLLIYHNLKTANLAQFNNNFYWSSTEVNTTDALGIDFDTGEIRTEPKSTIAHIRPIHTF